MTSTAVTESAKGLSVWMGSKERERMSHTRTAWSYPPLTTVSSPGPQHSCKPREQGQATLTYLWLGNASHAQHA